MGLEGYEFIPDTGADGTQSKKQERAQRQREEISRAAREMARTAPPPSPDLIARLRVLLSRRTSPEELVVWRLRLFCGHLVARYAHYTHTTVHAAFMGRLSARSVDLIRRRSSPRRRSAALRKLRPEIVG